jgi:hypothetical protein
VAKPGQSILEHFLSFRVFVLHSRCAAPVAQSLLHGLRSLVFGMRLLSQERYVPAAVNFLAANLTDQLSWNALLQLSELRGIPRDDFDVV